MRRLIALPLLLLLLTPAFAQSTKAPAEAELKKLLADFLAAASHSPAAAADKQMFDRFFADDVLYTRSAGATTTKREIMKSLDEPADPKAPTATFSAEDVTVHQFGGFAVVAFKLVQKVSDGSVNEFRNTGTFQRRKGRWQAIAWQATRVPKPEPKADKTGYVPPSGFVPDAATAIRIAEAVWTPIYGPKQLATEHPFKARLQGDVWVVEGSLPEGWDGGVAEARIAKTDGQVIYVMHGK